MYKRQVQNILTLLEFQNDRLMRALNGNGAFFTDVYIATPDEETKAAAQALAKSAWYDEKDVYKRQVIYMGLAEILDRRKRNYDFYNDDIRVLRNFVEYAQDNETLKYIIYELEVLDRTGELRRFFKAIKLVRVIRLPKSAKESLSFMDMHSQVLAGIWEQQINLITIIANMIHPVPLGLMFMYGIQGVAEDINTAKRIAEMCIRDSYSSVRTKCVEVI